MTKDEIISELYNEIGYVIRNYAYDNYGVKWGEDLDYCRRMIGTVKVSSMVNSMKYAELKEKIILTPLLKEMKYHHFNTAKKKMIDYLNDWLVIESY